MTKDEFNTLVSKGVVLLDGAVGSNMRSAGMSVGVSMEQWILEHPQVFQNLQQAYVNAGSQIVYAPTFAANRISLRHFGLEDQVVEINAALVRLSKSAVGNQAFVAGDLTTIGQFFIRDVTMRILFEVLLRQNWRYGRCFLRNSCRQSKQR